MKSTIETHILPLSLSHIHTKKSSEKCQTTGPFPSSSFKFLGLYYSWLTPKQPGSNGAPLGEQGRDLEECSKSSFL